MRSYLFTETFLLLLLLFCYCFEINSFLLLVNLYIVIVIVIHVPLSFYLDTMFEREGAMVVFLKDLTFLYSSSKKLSHF